MFLKNALPITLAFTSLFSIFMLQMGSDEETSVRLPLTALFVIPLGIWLVDVKRFFSLPEWGVNLLILLVILIHLGRIFQSPSAFLAYSIANILVYVQIILFYRKKDVLADYHILILSLIQGGVACVFQQHPMFAPLLLAFAFSLMTSLSLLLLNQERHYYRTHAFLKSAFDQGERVRRVTVGRLFVLAVKTVVVTPLIILWGYRWKEWSASDEEGDHLLIHDHTREDAKEKMPGTLLEFLHATWGDRALLGNPAGEENSLTGEPLLPVPSKPKTDSRLFSAAKEGNVGGTEIKGEGIRGNESENGPEGEGMPEGGSETASLTIVENPFSNASVEDRFHFVAPKRKRRFWSRTKKIFSPEDGVPENVRHGAKEEIRSRFPLLRATPLFSGAIRSGEEPTVGWRLVTRLGTGAFFSLVSAGLIFVFFPRLQEMEIGSVRLGHDQWRGAVSEIRSVTGFNENMKLGEIGPSGNNHQSVMKVRFVDFFDSDRQPVEEGTLVWMRGTVLARYQDREWFRPESENPSGASPRRYDNPALYSSPSRSGPRTRNSRDRRGSFGAPSPFSAVTNDTPQKIPGFVFSLRNDHYQRAIFDERHSVVRQEIRLYPLTTRIIFSVWPFFQFDHEAGLLVGERYLRLRRNDGRDMSLALMTNAFYDGKQAEWTPADKPMTAGARAEYSAVDLSRLPRLTELARTWDQESGLPKDNLAGRAKNLEDRLKNSGQFLYNRRGVARDGRLDPLEDFAVLHREGHCEYFAGCLAMMLRAIGIPSRVVVGFCFQNSPDSDGETVVRQSDAHSWVEAFIPFDAVPRDVAVRTEWWRDGAWLRLDATPSAAPEILRSVSMTYQTWREFFTGVWNDYILNYNGNSQEENVYSPVVATFSAAWTFVTERFKRLNPFRFRERNFMTGDETGRESDDGASYPWSDLLTILIVLSLLLVGMKWRLARRGLAEKGNRRPERAIYENFYRLENLLARFGIRRRSEETPREFITRFLAAPESAELCQLWLAAEDCPSKSDGMVHRDQGWRNDITSTITAERPLPKGGAKTGTAETTVMAEGSGTVGVSSRGILPEEESSGQTDRRLREARSRFGEALRELVEIYYRVRFGESPLGDSDREIFRRFFEETARISKEKRPRERRTFGGRSD